MNCIFCPENCLLINNQCSRHPQALISFYYSFNSELIEIYFYDINFNNKKYDLITNKTSIMLYNHHLLWNEKGLIYSCNKSNLYDITPFNVINKVQTILNFL